MVSLEERGTHKLEYNNAQGNNATLVFEVPSERVSAGSLDPTDYSALTYRPRLMSNAWVDEGGYIERFFKNASADTIESEESEIRLPILLKNKRSGQVQPIVLTSENFSTFKRSGTDDVVGSTTAFVTLGKYTVPTGFMAKVDASDVFHAYYGDDTA